MTRREKDERKMYFVTFILFYGEAAKESGDGKLLRSVHEKRWKSQDFITVYLLNIYINYTKGRYTSL